MKKIVIVDDNRPFIAAMRRVINHNFPNCNVVVFESDAAATTAISTVDKDFNILLLDGDLGQGGHGTNVLATLTPEQLQKTVVCSGNPDFVREAKEKGVTFFLNKGFPGIPASEVHLHILEILTKVSHPS